MSPSPRGTQKKMATPTIAREATRRGAAKSASMTAAGFQEAFERIVDNASLVIKGKESALRLVLTAMIADGHCLLEDMPGTGKTMMARALSTSIDARSSRIQCTPGATAVRSACSSTWSIGAGRVARSAATSRSGSLSSARPGSLSASSAASRVSVSKRRMPIYAIATTTSW